MFVFSVAVQVRSVSGRSPLDAAPPAIELIKIRVKYRHASHAERESEMGKVENRHSGGEKLSKLEVFFWWWSKMHQLDKHYRYK